MVRLLWALSDHRPRLLHPPLDVRAVRASSPGGDLVLPGGHLGILTRGRLEPLQRFIKARASLDGAVVSGAVGWVEFSFTVVWVVGPVRGGLARLARGGGVHLSEGAVVVRTGGAVVVTRGLVPSITRNQIKSHCNSGDKYRDGRRLTALFSSEILTFYSHFSIC